MIIPEVFLPWESAGTTADRQEDNSSNDGYNGRATLEFLDLLQANAEQMHTYLKTYIKHSEDFLSDVYIDLQNKFTTAQRLHRELRAHPRPSQEDLSTVASHYIHYMREVKTMCHNVWAKFDDFHINQGVVLFSFTVFLTLLSLFDLDFSVASLGKSFKFSLLLGVSLSLVSMVVYPLPLEFGVTSIMNVTLSLSFYPLLLYVVLHFLLLSHHIMYTLVEERYVFEQVFLFFGRLSFTYVFGAVVAICCGVSLASNSFILYEGDMTVFFLQSMLICFVVQRAQSLSGEYIPVIPSSSSGKKEENIFLEKKFSMRLVLSEVWPLVVAMVLVRLTKAFHACRDLRVGCEATSFIQPYHGVAETLGGLADTRLALSCLGVVGVPLALAWWVRYNGHSGKLGVLRQVCVYLGLPLSSLCVCGFWLIQSLPQPILDSLPHWQHVSLPRIVYTVSLSTIGVSIFAPLRKSSSSRQRDSVRQSNLPSGDGRRLRSEITVRQRLTANTNTPDVTSKKVDDPNLKKGYDTGGDTASLKKGDGFKLQDVESEKVEDVSLKRVGGEVVSLPVSVQLVMVPVLVALWLPLAMVLNDGVALSAVLLALQVYLVLSGLCHSQGQPLMCSI